MSKNRDHIVVLNRDAVRRIMNFRRLSRNAIARLLGKDPSEIRLWLTGRRNPSVDNAQDLADILICEIEHLTGEKPFDPHVDDQAASTGGAGSGHEGMTATLSATDILPGLIKVDRHFTLSDPIQLSQQLAELLEGLAKLLRSGRPVTPVGKPREGCVELTLRLTREQWNTLETALSRGELDHLKVIAVEPVELEQPLTSDPETAQRPLHGLIGSVPRRLLDISPDMWKEETLFKAHANKEKEVEALEEMTRLLSRLPESDRTLIQLRYIAELSMEQIANQMGLSSAAVYARLHRARARFRQLFEQGDEQA